MMLQKRFLGRDICTKILNATEQVTLSFDKTWRAIAVSGKVTLDALEFIVPDVLEMYDMKREEVLI